MTAISIYCDGTQDDTFLKDGSESSSNYYNYGTLYAGISAGAKHRTAIYFDGLSDGTIPADMIITLAELKLYKTNSAGAVLYAYRFSSSWDGTSITWNNQPGYDSTAVGSTSSAGTGSYMTIPLDTEVTQSMYDGTLGNYGYLLRTIESTSVGDLYGFEDSAGSTSQRPYLYIEYEEPASEASAGVGISASGMIYMSLLEKYEKIFGRKYKKKKGLIQPDLLPEVIPI